MPQQMPWDIKSIAVVATAVGGTIGVADWSADVDVVLSERPVQLARLEIDVTNGPVREENTYPTWAVYDADGVNLRVGGSSFYVVVYSSSSGNDFPYMTLSFGPWKIEGRGLVEGDSATFKFYFRP